MPNERHSFAGPVPYLDSSHARLASFGGRTDGLRSKEWFCKCECGTESWCSASNIKSGKSKSCGCLHNELLTERNASHGECDTSLYKRWASMKGRSTRPNKDYSNRGIDLCNEWMQFEPFRDWALSNGYHESLEIDRKDNDKGYSPDNCHWVTKKINGRNKRSNKLLTINGATKTVAEWSELSGVPYRTIQSRIKYGWNHNDLLSAVNSNGPKYKNRK